MTSRKSGKQPSTRVRQKRERNRQEILEAARSILGEGGVDAVTLGSVAGELGLTKQALYYYFPSKEVLVRNLMVMLLNDEVDTLIAAVEAEPSDAHVLSAMIHAFYGHYIVRLNEFRTVYCQPQMYTNPAEVLDEAVLREEINPRTRHLFDVLEARLSKESKSNARRKRARRLAYSAWLAALGLVTMLGVAEAAKDPLIYSDQDLIEVLARTFDAAVI
jgi:AcrR family transcriptional regulator